MGISLISLRNEAKYYIVFLKKTKANFFPLYSIVEWDWHNLKEIVHIRDIFSTLKS